MIRLLICSLLVMTLSVYGQVDRRSSPDSGTSLGNENSFFQGWTSAVKDPAEAGRIAAESLLRELGGKKTAVIFIAATNDFSVKKPIIEEVSRVFPGVPVWGLTTGKGFFMNSTLEIFNDHSVGLLALCSNDHEFIAAGAPAVRGDPLLAASEAFKQLPADKKPALFLLASFYNEHVNEILESIKDRFGPVPVFGGDTHLNQGALFFNGNVLEKDGLALLAVYTDRRIGLNFQSGFRVAGPEGLITAADLQRIREIDGKPAVDVYNLWTDNRFSERIRNGEDIFNNLLYYPLARVKKGSDGIDRHFVLAVNPEKDGSLNTYSPVRVGERLVLMAVDDQALVKRPGVSLLSARAMIGGDFSGGLSFYCAGSQILLEQKKQVNQLGMEYKKAFGKPFLALFTEGEYGCCPGSDSFHANLMLDTILFSGPGEKPEPGIPAGPAEALPDKPEESGIPWSALFLEIFAVLAVLFIMKRMLLQWKTLSGKLISKLIVRLCILFLICSLAFLTGFVRANRLVQDLEKSFVDRTGRYLISTVNRTTMLYLLARNYDQVASSCRDIVKNDPTILEFTFYDSYGQLIYHYSVLPGRVKAEELSSIKLPASVRRKYERLRQTGEGGHVFLTRKGWYEFYDCLFTEKKEYLGTLKIFIVAGKVRELLDQWFWQNIILYFLVTIAVIYLLLKGIRKSILNPIRALSDGIAGLSMRDYSRKVQVNTGDEFERLGQAFNRMMEELEKYSNGMEEQVRARTMELAATLEDLQRVSKIKDEFFASMSHELRTPLNSIIGFTEQFLDGLVGETQLDQEQRETLEMILRSGRHLLGLINDILDLSKIEAGKFQLTIEKVRLDETIVSVGQEVQAMLETVEKKGKYHFLTEIEENLPEIRADEKRVRQILLNLLSNAIKYSEQGEIKIRLFRSGFHGSADRNGLYATLAVSDQGVGIPEQQLDRIFDQYMQIVESRTKKVKGTGLGLSITKKLVEMHKGTIRVESVHGQGSTFIVTLPIGQ
ncbi:MAG: ATP-binding protein [Candidatus Wallbacteria bacterium]|nr:ATP-binding protein [Candidatus Wallbacteria bacterium]